MRPVLVRSNFTHRSPDGYQDTHRTSEKEKEEGLTETT